MITKRTVFVLGAGANVSYGFSTGGGLIDKVRGVDPRELMGDAGEQITRVESAAFRAAVLDNLLPSIDAMLEHRPDLVKVGKRVMATLLYKQEGAAGPMSFDEDWMSLIFTKMADGAATLDAFAQNAVSFVTFNYDRYLEHRFIRGLVSRYNVDGHTAWQRIAGMFVHLYGSLGKLAEQASPDPRSGELAVPLGAPDTEDTYVLGLALAIADNSIRIVHDAAALPESFADATRRFQIAQQVLFLGFGFGAKNVERLRVDRIPSTVPLTCTTYAMTPTEVLDVVIPAFPNRDMKELRRIGSTGTTSICLFLRERINWLH
jgi:hypothetical protein